VSVYGVGSEETRAEVCVGEEPGTMKIGVFMNGFTVRIAGGDYHAIRVARIWAKDHGVSVFLPRSGVSWVGHLLAPAKVSGYDTPLEQLVLNGVSGGIRVAIVYQPSRMTDRN